MHITEEITTPGSPLEEVYRRSADRLWRALLLYSGNREVASDAVSEAFAQALARGPGIRDQEAWIWKAAFRIAAGEMKSRRRTAASAEGSYEMPDPVPELLSALRNLSAKQRGAIVLHYYAGYSLTEVAQMLKSTPGAVAVHLHRGRARLRDLLEDHDG